MLNLLNWPPENCKYSFREQCDLDIPFKENKILKKAKTKKVAEDKGIGE